MRKDLMVTVLLTFCLTATLFMVAITKSQTEDRYDPWADLNGDGKIDILDVTGTTGRYAATGDPTKNVNVTNLPLDENANLKVKTIESTNEWQTYMVVPAHSAQHLKNATAGYRQITFLSVCFDAACDVQVTWLDKFGNGLISEQEFSLPQNTHVGHTYSIQGSRIDVFVVNNNNIPITVYFDFFTTT